MDIGPDIQNRKDIRYSSKAFSNTVIVEIGKKVGKCVFDKDVGQGLCEDVWPLGELVINVVLCRFGDLPRSSRFRSFSDCHFLPIFLPSPAFQTSPLSIHQAFPSTSHTQENVVEHVALVSGIPQSPLLCHH